MELESKQKNRNTKTNPSNSATRTRKMDPTLEKKRQAMLDRLANRHQSRAKPSAAAETDSSAATIASFLSKFSDSKRSIEAQISTLSSSEPDTDRIKREASSIAASISSLEQLFAESSYLLSPYEIRSSLNSLAELKQTLEALNSKLLPKKKFSFRTKSSKPAAEPRLPEEEPERAVIPVRDSPGFRDRAGEVLRKSFRGSEGGEFTLSRLDSCEVRLVGRVRALFVNKLKGCRVYVGAVFGSVLIEEVEDCVFVLASHQIRVHFAERCDFYLRVRSRPIIEDCRGVRFGPYCLRYDGIEEDLRDAGLEEETGDWSNVDDFKWLKAVKSPNWSVLEEGERVGSVEVDD